MTEALPKTRGRPRGFDEETALDQLTRLFWRKGYSQTSVADMVEASGVHKPTLYRIFGSKEELFAKVLWRYYEERMAMFSMLVDSVGPGADGIHQFLDLLRDDVVSGTSQNGCLLVISSIELEGTAPGFDDFGVVYRNTLREIMGRLVGRIEADPDVLSLRTDLFVTWAMGLDVVARGSGSDPEQAVAEVDAVIDSMRSVVDLWRDR